MVKSSRIEYLLQQHHDGLITQAEYDELITALNKTNNGDEFDSAMDQIWAKAPLIDFHSEREQEDFYQRIIQHESFKPANKTFKLKTFYRYAAAAVVLVTVSLGIVLYRYNGSAENRYLNHDITPGGNRAMLILSDGKKIDLENVSAGEIVHQAGMTVSKTKDGQLLYRVDETGEQEDNHLENTITTPKGGQYQVDLPDGTKVWLNAESSLSFPLSFSSKARTVSLSGEAYFEVAKKYKNQASSERIPFFVSTKNQRVEVLGTHFNVDAYPTEQSVKTTLLEGRVKVVALNGSVSAGTYLSPGQTATQTAAGIRVNTADTEEIMAWKNGLFIFNGQNLEAIMKEVERWYNVDVVFDDETLKQDIFNGSTSRFRNISELLEVLESTGSVHFKITGRRLRVMN